MFSKKKGFGLIIVRLPFYFTAKKINKVFSALLKEINIKDLINAIAVVELDRYRIRKFD